MRASLTAAALALVLAGFGQARLTPNVRGTVQTGAGAVAKCLPDEPCDPPMTGVFVVFSRPGHAPVRARTVGGAFTARLAPALYTVTLAPPPAGVVRPAAIRVPRTGVVRVTIAVQPKP